MRNLADNCCLTKALLESLLDDKSGLDLYLHFFENSQFADPNADVNVASFARFGTSQRAMRSMQYRSNEPYAEPPHFSFFSPQNVARLGQLNRVEIVIYYFAVRKGIQVPANPDENYWRTKLLQPYHDYRAISYSNNRIRDDDDDDDDDEVEAIIPTVFYVVTSKKQLFRFANGSVGADAAFQLTPPFFCDRDSFFTGVDFPSEPPDFGFGDFVTAAESVLRQQGNLDDLGPPLVFHPFNFTTINRRDLTLRWHSILDESTSVIIVSFVRLISKALVTPDQLVKPGRSKFSTLCIVPSYLQLQSERTDGQVDSPNLVTSESQVLCIYGRRFVCSLSEEFRLDVINRHLKAVGAKERLHNQRSIMPDIGKRIPPQDIVDAYNEKMEQKRGTKKIKQGSSLLEKICKCPMCIDPKYEKNMFRSGPERLCTSPHTIRQLLRIMGLYDSTTEGLLKQVCELSVASMDIEARTVALDLEGPRPGPCVVYDEISTPVLEGHLKKVQKPVMIAHTDARSFNARASSSDGSQPRQEQWCDTARDDSEKAIFDMFERYWLYVEERQSEMARAKRELLTPILAKLTKYQEAFEDYSKLWIESSRAEKAAAMMAAEQRIRQIYTDNLDNEEDVDVLVQSARDKIQASDDWRIPKFSDIVAAYRQTIPGRLADSLMRLIKCYVVFTFYGYVVVVIALITFFVKTLKKQSFSRKNF